MEKVTIEKVYVSDKKKSGESFGVDKFTKLPKYRIGIKVKGFEEWMSCFITEKHPLFQWKGRTEPFEADIIIEHEPTSSFWNFRLPTKQDVIETRIDKLESAVTMLFEQINDDKKRSS